MRSIGESPERNGSVAPLYNSAENPQHVARVLAEILDGRPTPHPFSSNGYIVFLFEEHGTEIASLFQCSNERSTFL